MAELGAIAAATGSEEKALESNEEYSSEVKIEDLWKRDGKCGSLCLIKGLRKKLRYPG